MSDFKYKLLKAIDLSGLTFLTPVVRLCYGEDPRKQLREIVRFILVPSLAFLLFLGLWAYVAPLHKTKSGEVPTPYVVWDAATSIWTFHVRESKKEDAYELTGKSREEQLKVVDRRLVELEALEAQANAQVAASEADRIAQLESALKPVQARVESTEGAIALAVDARTSDLQRQAEQAIRGSIPEKEAYLAAVREHLRLSAEETELLAELRLQTTELQARKSPAVVAALRAQSHVAEERQFLVKLRDQLNGNSREAKAQEAIARLNVQKRAFIKAKSPNEAFALAQQIARDE